MSYKIKCHCGYSETGETRREAESKMWRHKLNNHSNEVKEMSAHDIRNTLDDWDKKFREQIDKIKSNL